MKKTNNLDNILGSLRGKLGLSAEQMAQQTGISVNTIRSIENGNRNITPRVLSILEKTYPNDSLTESVALETAAMGKVYYALLNLSEDGRKRVVEWVYSRLANENTD